ncbi:MAG: pentapeptide repeat-containing protein [Bryobacteraceae bacterium]
MRHGTVKANTFKRALPDLPAEFEAAQEPRSLVDGESVALQEAHLLDLNATNLNIHALRIEGCVLERVQLAGGQFGSATWKDVRLVGCDLANIKARRMTLLRVELIDCRLTGLSVTALDWQDVLIQNGDVRYARFPGGNFRSCEFAASNWQETDLQGADLSGCVFRSCNLSRTDLQGARLQNADVRQSEVEGLLVAVRDLKGLIVDPAQAMVLAPLLGIQIK